MIRELLGESKKRKHVKQVILKEDLENISVKLRNISKKRPNLDIQNSKISAKLLQSGDTTAFMTNPEQKRYDASVKKTIKWNSSANSWTRETSPSHKIPQSRRFNELKKQSNEYYPELSLNIRTSLDKTGVSFTKQPRKQLFKKHLQTPSPQNYKISRFLENRNTSMRTYISYKVNEQKEQGEHIIGGSIGKFTRYQNLYYPHTKKLNYNEKLIEQARGQLKPKYMKYNFQNRFISI